MTGRLRESLLAQLRREVFALDRHAGSPPRVGAEVELIPVDATTRRVAPIEAIDRPATLPVLRTVGARLGWGEMASIKAGVPEFRTPPGGRITFEPGGQIEYSAPPSPSVSGLARDARGMADTLREALGEAGLHLVTVGIDPANSIEEVPLQLTAPRYRRMAAHFATIGPHGARMMRQTASIQVCVDAGPTPSVRWRLLNALAPYLAAIFANSSIYAGEATGYRSVRRGIWGALDPARTGLPWDPAHPVEAYLDFALGAASLLGDVDEPPFPAFGALADAGRVSLHSWRAHLSTLFPEVRPRGYFEVRSIDALAPEWYAVPLVVLAGLVYDDESTRAAMDLVGEPDASLLDRAGRCGLADPSLATTAEALFQLALRGAESLGPEVVSDDDLATAQEWFDRYTRWHLTPADESLAGVSAAAGSGMRS